jgi:hypothetical protein
MTDLAIEQQPPAGRRSLAPFDQFNRNRDTIHGPSMPQCSATGGYIPAVVA